jgi:hypothetical protein
MHNPWFKFYPSDWRADVALRACSFAARGLWIDLLSLMHESDGELRLNGRALSVRQIATLIGARVREVTRLLSELEAAQVFSRTADGAIFSRRMKRDRARSEEGRKAVTKRWGPSQQQKKGYSSPAAPSNAEAVISDQSAKPLGDLKGEPIRFPITQKPEARSQNKEARTAVPRNAAPNLWERWATSWEIDPAGDPNALQPVRAGVYFNTAAALVCQAAQIEDQAWRGDWDSLAGWLDAGIDLHDGILPAIQRVAARHNYRPPNTLRYFDGAVREERPRTNIR